MGQIELSVHIGLCLSLKSCSAVVMGILKFAFMLTTAGDLDTTFDYWVHFWQKEVSKGTQG